MRKALKFFPFLILIIVFFLDEKVLEFHFMPYEKWYILAFFFALKIINDSIIFLAFQNGKSNFIPFYLGTVIIRMVLSLLFLSFYLFFLHKDSTLFILCFFGIYLFLTMFEIIDINSKLRRFLEKEKIVENK